MKVSGKKTEPTDMESLFMLMAIFMKEIGQTIKQMEKEFTFILMEQDMRDIGRMIYNMVKEKRHGPMDQYMRENIIKERNMGMEFTVGMMGLLTQEIGLKIK